MVDFTVISDQDDVTATDLALVTLSLVKSGSLEINGQTTTAQSLTVNGSPGNHIVFVC